MSGKRPYMQSAYSGLVRVPETHTRASTEYGPDFCEECSAAAVAWVVWPCEWVEYDHARCGQDGMGCAAPVADYDPTCNTTPKGMSTPDKGPSHEHIWKRLSMLSGGDWACKCGATRHDLSCQCLDCRCSCGNCEINGCDERRRFEFEKDSS